MKKGKLLPIITCGIIILMLLTGCLQGVNKKPTLEKVDGPTATIDLSSSTFTWEGNDPDGEIAKYEYRKDGGGWEDNGLSTTYEWSGYTEGEHTFEVRARDDDGDYSEIVSWTFTYESSNILFSEDFETGDFSAHDWTLAGSETPIVQSDEVYEGNYAVQLIGGVTEYDQWCRLGIEVNLEKDSVISFYRKINYSGDLLNDEHYFWFEIDGNLAGLWMGDAQWHEVVREVPAGTHTLTWHFASLSSETKAFVDNIKIVNNMDLGDVVNIPDANLKTNILAFLGKYPVSFPLYSQAFNEDFEQETKYEGIREIFNNFEETDKNNIDTQEYDNQKVYEKELEDFTIFLPIVPVVDSVGGISNLTGIEYMPNLVFLNLYNNQITDVTPLQNLTNLRLLELSSNQITNLDPLHGLTNLTRLYLGYNPLPKSEIEFLHTWDWMSGLGLKGLNLTSSDISFLSDFDNMEDLQLNDNQISNLDPLQNLAKLTRLYLGYNQITDITPLQNMTHLWGLYLYNNNIEDIQPLVDNTGIGSGDWVDISYNYLDITTGSEDMEDINTLESREVNVHYYPQK